MGTHIKILDCIRLNFTNGLSSTENNIRTGIYHAGLSLRDRNETHRKFLSDELDVVVATVAFGMGIDKPSESLFPFSKLLWVCKIF